MKRKEAKAKLALLTPRQREVLEMVVHGWRNSSIAKELAISIKTVESHRSSARLKLRTSTMGLVTMWIVAHGA